jgi:glutaredoxin
MAVPLTSRKKRALLTAFAALFFFLVVFSTTGNKQANSLENAVPNVAGGNNAKVQIPSITNKPSANVPDVDEKVPVKTKKITNANNLVKSKEGLIDESKVRAAESNNDYSNIPLVAGDPTSKKAHDKNAGSDDKGIDTGSNAKIGKAKNISNKYADEDEEAYATADSDSSNADVTPNGIKANKLSGTQEQQKDSLKKGNTNGARVNVESNEDVNSNSEKVDAPKPNRNSQVMKAQEKGPTKNEGSSFNPVHELQSILMKSPVVIFSKSYCPFSKKLKHLLKTEYQITPAPVIVELDEHENGAELQKHVGEETGRFTVPNIIIGGESRGGADDIVALHENNELMDLFHTWAEGGAKIKKLGSTDSIDKGL